MIKRIFGYALAGALLAGLPVMAQKGSTSGPTLVKDVDNRERQSFHVAVGLTFSAGEFQAPTVNIPVPAGKLMVVEQVTPYCELGAQNGQSIATVSFGTYLGGEFMIHFLPVDVKPFTQNGTVLNVANSSILTRMYADPANTVQVTLIRKAGNLPAINNSCHMGISGYLVNAQ